MSNISPSGGREEWGSVWNLQQNKDPSFAFSKKYVKIVTFCSLQKLQQQWIRLLESGTKKDQNMMSINALMLIMF